jgi:hypothetical protein
VNLGNGVARSAAQRPLPFTDLAGPFGSQRGLFFCPGPSLDNALKLAKSGAIQYAGVAPNDRALLVEKNHGGIAGDTQIGDDGALRAGAQELPIVGAQGSGRAVDTVGLLLHRAVALHGDADHFQVLNAVLGLEFGYDRNGIPAGRTPSAPEIQQDQLAAALLFQFPGDHVDVVESEIHQLRADKHA